MFKKSKILLLCILFLGLFLRLYGNNWDQGWHLHPDERFLTMVGVDVKIPPTFSQYLNQQSSSFNPVNRGHSFYVYGTFPILLNKVLAQYFYNDTYDQFNLQGRVLSGIADFLVVVILYKLMELIEKKLKLNKSIKFISAFFYAIAVLPIQLSHFFTVDTFLNLFCWASLYFAIKLVFISDNVSPYRHSGDSDVTSEDSRIDFGPACPAGRQARMTVVRFFYYMSLSGLFLGLALACKVSAVYFVPLVGLFILINLVKIVPIFSVSFPRTRESRGRLTLSKLRIIDWIPVFTGMTAFFVSFYLALRLGSPYYFETNNIFNPELSKVFLANINTLKSFENPQVLFPPAIQWIHASPFLSLINVIFFGIGPIYFLCTMIGLFVLLRNRKNIFLSLALIWVFGFTLYQSVQFAKTMRYLIFIYPFLAIFAAVGSSYLFNKISKLFNTLRYTCLAGRQVLYILFYAAIVIWPLAFMSIYTKDHSRVTASHWIYDTIPSESTILTEYWDDPLPLTVQDPFTRNYKIIEVHIFDPDTPEKWNKIDDQLKKADYYVMSSNRGWGSIPTAPERYPIASQFYKDMLEEKNGYTLVKQFSSYPSLRYMGIPLDFPDQWSEEAFTVYDHPLVYIFKKK